MVIKKLTEGWGQPGDSKRSHYFRESRSLCLAWLFTGLLEADDGKSSSGDCKKCRKALDKNPPPKASE